MLRDLLVSLENSELCPERRNDFLCRAQAILRHIELDNYDWGEPDLLERREKALALARNPGWIAYDFDFQFVIPTLTLLFEFCCGLNSVRELVEEVLEELNATREDLQEVANRLDILEDVKAHLLWLCKQEAEVIGLQPGTILSFMMGLFGPGRMVSSLQALEVAE